MLKLRRCRRSAPLRRPPRDTAPRPPPAAGGPAPGAERGGGRGRGGASAATFFLARGCGEKRGAASPPAPFLPPSPPPGAVSSSLPRPPRCRRAEPSRAVPGVGGDAADKGPVGARRGQRRSPSPGAPPPRARPQLPPSQTVLTRARLGGGNFTRRRNSCRLRSPPRPLTPGVSPGSGGAGGEWGDGAPGGRAPARTLRAGGTRVGVFRLIPAARSGGARLPAGPVLCGSGGTSGPRGRAGGLQLPRAAPRTSRDFFLLLSSFSPSLLLLLPPSPPPAAPPATAPLPAAGRRPQQTPRCREDAAVAGVRGRWGGPGALRHRRDDPLQGRGGPPEGEDLCRDQPPRGGGRPGRHQVLTRQRVRDRPRRQRARGARPRGLRGVPAGSGRCRREGWREAWSFGGAQGNSLFPEFLLRKENKSSHPGSRFQRGGGQSQAGSSPLRSRVRRRGGGGDGGRPPPLFVPGRESSREYPDGAVVLDLKQP